MEIFDAPAELTRFLNGQLVLQGYAQADLAQAVGVNQPTVSEWLRAQNLNVSSAMVLANALGFRLAAVPFEAKGEFLQ